jgi:hypothetical protein
MIKPMNFSISKSKNINLLSKVDIIVSLTITGKIPDISRK